MAHWVNEWLLPVGTLTTALAALLSILHMKRQYYWEKAPIIEIELVVVKELVTGEHIMNQPAGIEELHQWNQVGVDDDFVIAKVTNKQKEPMGVATGIQLNVGFTFPHPSEPAMVCTPTWKYEKFWLTPEETYLVVLANLRGLPTGTVDILSIEWYDIRQTRHREARGFCKLEITTIERWSRFKSLQ